MFIKLHFQTDNAFKIFRVEDIISIDPVFGVECTVVRYCLFLRGNQEVLAITAEQAHDLSLQLNPSEILHPSQYE